MTWYMPIAKINIEIDQFLVNGAALSAHALGVKYRGKVHQIDAMSAKIKVDAYEAALLEPQAPCEDK